MTEDAEGLGPSLATRRSLELGSSMRNAPVSRDSQRHYPNSDRFGFLNHGGWVGFIYYELPALPQLWLGGTSTYPAVLGHIEVIPVPTIDALDQSQFRRGVDEDVGLELEWPLRAHHAPVHGTRMPDSRFLGQVIEDSRLGGYGDVTRVLLKQGDALSWKLILSHRCGHRCNSGGVVGLSQAGAYLARAQVKACNMNRILSVGPQLQLRRSLEAKLRALPSTAWPRTPPFETPKVSTGQGSGTNLMTATAQGKSRGPGARRTGTRRADKPATLFECEECTEAKGRSVSFNSNKDLMRHKSTTKAHNAQAVLRCSCGKTVTRKDAMRLHHKSCAGYTLSG
ncbi:hypothetical protein BJV74DRAFT_911485 [Russula compacta]|nr:hypothetical protein BJV74DRAFT_911485 [Russula compacta]